MVAAAHAHGSESRNLADFYHWTKQNRPIDESLLNSKGKYNTYTDTWMKCNLTYLELMGKKISIS